MVHRLSIVAFSILFLFGCATIQKTSDSDLDTGALRKQIDVLQKQLEQREQQLISLQETLDKESKERAMLATQVGVLSGKYKPVTFNASVKQIQLALRKAGFEPGAVDGVMGSKTRKAIRRFQEANLLPITGKVDKATWLKLRVYLSKKIK